MREAGKVLLRVVLAGSLASLGGCTGLPELPYPKLAQIVKVKTETLTAEEQQKLIEELKREQKTHEESAVEQIEKSE